MTKPKWYDFTIPREDEKFENLCTALKSWKAEKFVIGIETGGNTGYEHWQGRVVFKKPMTLAELLKLQIEAGVKPGHWTPTHVHNFDYCEKEGNFYRSWEGALAKYRDLELREWQKECIADVLGEQSERQCTVIVDYCGNQGKSYLAKHLVVKYGFAYVPAMPNFEDYMFMAMAHSSAKGFIFDLPRADTIQQKKAMWMAMETIKNGYLYDKRYEFREMWIEPPKMLVLCNEEPPKDMLSLDRWRIYYLYDRWNIGEPLLEGDLTDEIRERITS